jgi:hypothetical protein
VSSVPEARPSLTAELFTTTDYSVIVTRAIMKSILLAIAVVFVFPGPGVAAASDPAPAAPADPTAPAAPAKPAKGSPDEIVCKTPQVTGSLFPGKERCMTRRDWEQERQNSLNSARANGGYIGH